MLQRGRVWSTDCSLKTVHVLTLYIRIFCQHANNEESFNLYLPGFWFMRQLDILAAGSGLENHVHYDSQGAFRLN